MRPLLALLAVAVLPAAELRVELGPARLVAQGPPGEKRWGRWQFPTLETGPRGLLFLSVHTSPDSAASYGQPRQLFLSRNHGRTWTLQPARAAQIPSGLALPSGQWLRTATVAATPVASVTLPPPVAERQSYGTPFQLYPLLQMPAALRQIFFERFENGAWRTQSQTLDAPPRPPLLHRRPRPSNLVGR